MDEDDHFSASWQTSVKEIVKGTVVICPAFCCEMTLVTDKKSRVFVVLLKFELPENGIAPRAREASCKTRHEPSAKRPRDRKSRRLKAC